MDLKTTVPTEHLSSWFFAVRWSRMAVQERIEKYVEYGWSTQYDEEMVSRLASLESYLQATHDEFMDWLERPVAETSNV